MTIQTLKTENCIRSEWIERILFANGEDAFSERLIGLSVIGKLVKYQDSLADIMRVAAHYAQKIDQQIAVIDVTAGDPSVGRFLSVGNYRMKGEIAGPLLVSDLPNVVQRKQVAEDYYMARTLGVPLFAKVRAQMNGERWYYDRILVPVRTQDLSVLISAYWHHDALTGKKL